MLAPVIQTLHGRPVVKGDPLPTVRALRDWTGGRDGWAGVRQRQVAC